jgi:transcription antitermination factor NusA-like protein
MAEHFVERSDHIFFLLTDDKGSSSELDRFGLIQTQGKGVTVLLNIKSKDKDLDLLHDEPKLVFRENELDGHQRRISGYLNKHFDMPPPPVIPYHARAAWLGRRPENLKKAAGLRPDILMQQSRIYDVENRICSFIKEESYPTRIRTPRDLLNGYIISVKNELRPFAGQFRELIKKYGTLRQDLEQGIKRARQKSNRRISGIRDYYQNASDLIPGMVDELINSGKGGKAFSNSWKLLLENSDVTTVAGIFAEAAKQEFYNETKEKLRIAAFDTILSSTDSIGKQFDEYKDTKESIGNHKYARAGLRAGVGTAATAAAVAIVNWWNPAGWIAAAAFVGSIAVGIGAERLTKKGTDHWEKSDKEKLYKRRNEIICNLEALLWDDHKATCLECEKWLGELMAAYKKEFNQTLGTVEEESKKLWQLTVDALDQLDSVATRLNLALVHQLFDYIVPEAARESINVIAVAREPGYATKLLVQGNNTLEGGVIGYCIGRNGSRVRQLSSYLGGERISFVESDAQHSTQVLQALSPAKLKVEDIQLESNDNGLQHVHILTEGEKISHVLGKHGVNLRLAKELLNMKIYCDPKEAKK